MVADLQPSHVAPLGAALEADYYIDAEAVSDAVRRWGSFSMIHLDTMFKRFRRLATRDEKRAVNDKALRTWAAILLWLSLENRPSSMGGVLLCLRDTMSWTDATGRVQP